MGAAEDRAELVGKLKALCLKRFGSENAWPQLFAAYDGNHDGAIGRAELEALLTDASIGNVFSRGHWVTGVILALDKAEDGSISRVELESAIASSTPPKGTSGKPLTRKEARQLASLLAVKPGAVDLSAFSQADLALIEEENIKLTTKKPDPLTVTSKVPPIPKGASSSDFGSQVLVGVIAGLVLWAITKGR